MRLTEIEGLPSFALLGPGFGGRPFLLLSDLRSMAAGPASLVFAGFEQHGRDAVTLGAGTTETCTIEFEPQERPFSVISDFADHSRKVAQIREAIAAGDVYQVCLTVRARLGAQGGAEILSRMCRDGIPRFAAWVRMPDGLEFVSASPELFFEITGRKVRSQPMKGTARPEQGMALAGSEKDRAELAMITDLIRNDLSKVCRPKSVRVVKERHTLLLPYAAQTVSDVVGIIDEDKSAMDVLAALHPGGSVTGAPKEAALEMIRRLEPHPRGPYCGTLGFVREDRAVFALLIRTATKSHDGWTYGVGSGIVFDSDPQAELQELAVKLGALSSD